MECKLKPIIIATLLAVGLAWLTSASAADNIETVKGTISQSTNGYGIRLDDGTLIRFMGRGGNTVFAACHNGDSCEISGVVTHDTKTPLFLSVTQARKLAVSANTAPSPDDQQPLLLENTEDK